MSFFLVSIIEVYSQKQLKARLYPKRLLLKAKTAWDRAKGSTPQCYRYKLISKKTGRAATTLPNSMLSMVIVILSLPPLVFSAVKSKQHTFCCESYPYFFCCRCCILAQLSFRATVLLKTSSPGLESTISAQKYPCRSN